MDGLKSNGVTLYLGVLPGRKQSCFYFVKGDLDMDTITPAGYIRKDLLAEVEGLWGKMIERVPSSEDEYPVVAKDGARYKNIGFYIDAD